MSHVTSKKNVPLLIHDKQNNARSNIIKSKVSKPQVYQTKSKNQYNNATNKTKAQIQNSRKAIQLNQSKVKTFVDRSENSKSNSEPSQQYSRKQQILPSPANTINKSTYQAINKALVNIEKTLSNFSPPDESGGDRGNQNQDNSESLQTLTGVTDITDPDSNRFEYEDKMSDVAKQMKQVLHDLKVHLLNVKKSETIEDFASIGQSLEIEFKRKISTEQNNIQNEKNSVLPKIEPKKKPVQNPVVNTKPAPTKSQSRPTSRQSQRPQSPQKRRSSSLPPKTKGPSSLSLLNTISDLKNRAQDAIKDRKIFLCNGQWEPVRKALTARGWVESIIITAKTPQPIKRYMTYSLTNLYQLMRFEELQEVCHRVILSKLVEGHTPNLFWAHRYVKVPDGSVINKFRNEVFSYASKGGLCEGSKQEYWWRIPDISGINHPRTYLMSITTDMQSFIKDYRITAAMSLLKWVVKTHEKKEQKVISDSGKISLRFFNFAIMECYKFVKTKSHYDIDAVIVEASDQDWKLFLDAFYKIMHIGNHFKKGNTTEVEMVKKSCYLLKSLEEYWPYMQMDGYMNLWILKPVDCSMGIGINVCRALGYIMNIVKRNKRSYIAQKYIERPFLIHNTKFDIRQYFLISCSNPLTIWMYKSCYLRFCSQTYNLNNLHEAIHLTNNSVQKKYMRPVYDPALPSYLMWTSDQFKIYLENIGFPDAFDKIIYPEMKKCFTAAVLMRQNKIDKRTNCFELYGADFVITEDFKAWLIEINSNPALFSSTPVTKQMCPRVLEDVVKVIIDYPKNPSCSTGGFELIYQQKEKHFEKTKLNLKLSGVPAPKEYFANSDSELRSVINPVSTSDYTPDELREAEESISTFGSSLKETLESLQHLIKLEKIKNNMRKSESTATVDTQRSVQSTNCNMFQEFYKETHKDDCVSSSFHNLTENDSVAKSLLTLLNVIKTEKFKVGQKIPERARSKSPGPNDK